MNIKGEFALASAGIVALAGAAFSAEGPQFEVASVRPSVVDSMPAGAGARDGGGGPACLTRFSIERGRVDIRCLTLTALIGHAFGVLPDRITGPGWMAASDAPKFDIVATLPQGASENQVPQMLQALLADRFKLASHRENKERTVYGLVVARGGLKAKKSSPDADTPAAVAAAGPDAASAPPSAVVNVGGAQTRVMDLPSRGGGTTAMTSPGMGTVLSTMGPNGVERLEASDITFEALAGLLSTLTVAPVPIVDMTGMKGRYQVVLELSWKELGAARTAGVALDPASDPAILAAQLDDFRQSLQKYGLRLESRKRPVETMVVDRLEKTPAAN